MMSGAGAIETGIDPPPRRTDIVVITILITFITAVVLDVVIPRGYGAGFLFLIPLLLSMYLRDQKVTLSIALVTVPVIVLGYFASPPGDFSASIFNRAATLIVLAITTYLIILKVRDEELIVDYAKEAEERGQYLRGIIETIPMPILVYDLAGNPMITNPPGAALWKGRPPQPGKEIDGKIFRAGTKESVTPDEYAISRLLRGDVIRDEQVDVHFSDGTERTLLIYAAPIKGKGGSTVGGVVAYLDITVIVGLRNELKRSNDELRQFAYVASHDLKQPLATISSYMELLLHRYKGKVLDERAESYIETAACGSRHLAELIDSLLQFSLVTQDVESFQRVDMNQIVEQVRKNLAAMIVQYGATLSHDVLPIISAAPQQMVHLIQNLASNGIKFHGKDPPRVHISATREGKFWLFSVQDNGIGIDPKNQNEIFKMFSRLHSQSEYEGTGIGLALVKRIIERHGGRVWFESEPGRGSIFYFTIPLEPRNGKIGIIGEGL